MTASNSVTQATGTTLHWYLTNVPTSLVIVPVLEQNPEGNPTEGINISNIFCYLADPNLPVPFPTAYEFDITVSQGADSSVTFYVNYEQVPFT